ncbi:MAG: HTH-type transcriptional repressor YtrA [Verrucomicrobiota bacterium]|jgi:GntR family transcriptional regulator|nr:GntR family transcriptional regulator [Verrucomicrobiota bacterium]
MIARIDFQSGVPVYLQIVQQVKAAAATGLIRPGDPLPSVRAMAEDLRINRNTVARAYAELESESVIETRQGSGCFLKDGGASPLRKSVRSGRLAEALDAVIIQAHHLQIPDPELQSLLIERLEAFHLRQKDHQAPRD